MGLSLMLGCVGSRVQSHAWAGRDSTSLKAAWGKQWKPSIIRYQGQVTLNGSMSISYHPSCYLWYPHMSEPPLISKLARIFLMSTSRYIRNSNSKFENISISKCTTWVIVMFQWVTYIPIFVFFCIWLYRIQMYNESFNQRSTWWQLLSKSVERMSAPIW